MAGFKWDKKKIEVSLGLAEGKTVKETAENTATGERTIYNWKLDPEFSAEVDRLTLMMGIASKAERLRMVKKLVRQRMDEDGNIQSEKDVLDWLKFAQSETDELKLGLAALAKASGLMADTGPD